MIHVVSRNDVNRPKPLIPPPQLRMVCSDDPALAAPCTLVGRDPSLAVPHLHDGANTQVSPSSYSEHVKGTPLHAGP